MKRKAFTALILALYLFTLFTPSAVLAADGDLAVDLTGSDSENAFYGAYNVLPVGTEDGVSFVFTNTGEGMCFDPYVSIDVDVGVYDCEELPYFAMLVKTDYSGKKGQIRFKTEDTQSEYPCQSFRYADTDGFQLITVKLTDRSRVQFYPSSLGEFTGRYTNIRLDMFDNECDVNTGYTVKAYGLFKTEEDAERLTELSQSGDNGENEGYLLSDIDYSEFTNGEEYAKPPLEYRMRYVSYGFSKNTAPLYAYLDRGYGGVVSNVNFNSGYLKDKTEFETLDHIYSHAHSLGMNTWIYDEYQWPSGKAFGQVLDEDPSFEAVGIEHKVLYGGKGKINYEISNREIKIMDAYVTALGETKKAEFSDTALSCTAEGDYKLDIYVLRYTHSGNEDRNDFTTLRDVDLLNKDAVNTFIELTYERYKTGLTASFDSVSGFFTDEPQLGNRGMISYAVWTEGLEDRYKEKYGTELHIPSIFSGNTDTDKMTRLCYYRLVSEMFKESYTGAIADWCEQNGKASSGHLLFEEDMNDHVETYGGDFLQIVGEMTVPGADVLWIEPQRLMGINNIGNYMGLRYVASAAKNNNKSDVMLEFNPDAASTLPKDDPLYYSIGGASIARLLGYNIFHVINPQNSYSAREINELNTYIGRLNLLLDGAKETSSLAVFYPIADVQALHNADRDHSSTSGRGSAAVKLNSSYEALCGKLLNSGLTYTVIDDASLSSADIEGGTLGIGCGRYTAVVVPYTKYISPDALTKLKSFAEGGGKVIFIKDTPEHGLLPGEDGTVIRIYESMEKQYFKELSSDAMSAILDSAPTLFSVGDTGLLLNEYESGDSAISFIVNVGRDEISLDAAYSDGYTGEITVYTPGTGMIEILEGAEKKISVPSYEGVLIVRPAPKAPDADTETDTEITGADEDKKDYTPLIIAISASVAAAAAIVTAVFTVIKKRRSGKIK